jgi:hypothetical protein
LTVQIPGKPSYYAVGLILRYLSYGFTLTNCLQ